MIEVGNVNDTLRFILPMFYDQAKGLTGEFFLNEFLEGAYTSDLKRPEFDDKLILAYEYFPNEKFVRFENRLKANLPVTIYQNPHTDIYVYILDIPEEFIEDYESILAGEFDQLSPTLKLNIIKMWGLTPDSNLFKVLTGDLEYEGEQFEKEIFNL